MARCSAGLVTRLRCHNVKIGDIVSEGRVCGQRGGSFVNGEQSYVLTPAARPIAPYEQHALRQSSGLCTKVVNYLVRAIQPQSVGVFSVMGVQKAVGSYNAGATA